jgi:hypothetical protein
MTVAGQPAPRPNERILCRHPFDEKTRAWAKPARIEVLLSTVWDGTAGGLQIPALPSLSELRAYVRESLSHVRDDHLRAVRFFLLFGRSPRPFLAPCCAERMRAPLVRSLPLPLASSHRHAVGLGARRR